MRYFSLSSDIALFSPGKKESVLPGLKLQAAVARRPWSNSLGEQVTEMGLWAFLFRRQSLFIMPSFSNSTYSIITENILQNYCQSNISLKEKRQGYHYEHIFSHDFDAMRGYHYLMHIARMLNEMAFHSVSLTEHVKTVGFRDFIKDFKEAMINTGLDKEMLIGISKSPGRLRLVTEEDWKTRKTAA